MRFGKYLKEQQKTIWMILGVVCIFWGVLRLYRITSRVVLYPAMLCILFAGIWMLADFFAKKKKLQQLQEAFEAGIDQFPEPQSVLEETYQECIADLHRQYGEMTLKQEMRYRDMEDYYTTWAHQIKTPISAMQLKLQNEDSPLSRQLNSDLLRVEQYVDMVMVYLRLGAPTNDYVFKSWRIDELIKKSVSTFASEFISRGLALRYEKIEGSLITDDKWFCFVLEQILSNALKYTHSGGISIYMEENGILCISDTGIGIAPEDLPRIFEKGYTGFNGRTDRHASGLGLYLCRRICDGLSIPLQAQSQPGKGTVIRLCLEQYHLKAE